MKHSDQLRMINVYQNTGDWYTVLKIQDTTRHVVVYANALTKELFVGFDGTQGKLYWFGNDWLANLRAWTKGYTVGSRKYTAMAGFIEEYLTFRSTLLEQIELLKPETIHVAGFSQGGAHAPVFVRDVLYNYPHIKVTGFTAGAPRVYTRKSAKEFERATRNVYFSRYYGANDPVPHLPPWFLGYKHVGIPTKIKLSFHGLEHYIDALTARGL